MQTEGNLRVSAWEWLSIALVIVGALNWGLVGLGYFANANWNLVDLIFGGFESVENLIYIVVGLAGLLEIWFAYQLYVAASRSRERVERPA